MKHLLWSLGIAAASHATFVAAQAPHAHQHQPASSAQAKAPTLPAAKKPEASQPKGYESAFADYRPFNPEEPLKDWRASNDEVRAAGGHVGILKSQEKDAKP